MFFWLMKILTFIPLKVLFPTIVVGKKNIPKGRAILVCNHRSNIDYVYLFTFLWRKQYVLSKEELYKNRFVSKFFKLCGGIPVNRDNVGIGTIKSSLKVLNKDKVLTIFPEGTRNKTGSDLLEFKGGASIFSVKTNAPIIPIFITKRPRLFILNRIVIGEPIILDKSYLGEDGVARANNIIREKMLELKNK